MIESVRYASLLLLLVIAGTWAQHPNGNGTTSPDDNETPASATSSVFNHLIGGTSTVITPSQASTATCPSRTINYITHTLPQQCLRTDRVSQNGTQSYDPHDNRQNSTLASSPAAHGTLTPSEKSAVKAEGTVPASVLITEAVDITQTPGSATSHLASIVPAEPASASAAVVIQEPTEETDPLLDDSSFLSFEEWKKQNLAKTGQSPENVGQERPLTGERQRPGINNALDTLGEESEIDLDFTGFGGGQSARASSSEPDITLTAPTSGQASTTANRLRSKDAGRTCKERTNYASFDCSANILKSNPECKSASSVLVENKDSYMLNTCAANNKFFIVELCNDIHIDTIVLANYEFFSSIFRHFRVSVSDRYPVKMEKWRELGTFEAQSTREVQAFLVEDPQIWARYLRIEFLSHFGSEYYCPVSLLRVHGKTMMQEFRQEEEMARGELPDEEPTVETASTPQPLSREPLASTDESRKGTIQAPSATDTLAQPDVSSVAPNTQSHAPNATNPANDNASAIADEYTQPPVGTATCGTSTDSNISTIDPASLASHALDSSTNAPEPQRIATSPSIAAQNTKSRVTEDVVSVAKYAGDTNTTRSNATSKIEMEDSSADVSAASLNLNAAISVTAQQATNSTSSTSQSSNTTRTPASSTPLPQASSQESFFKSIHKRLQQLESNSTLSLQYIEEQSRILRDAFNKVEKRQISATSTFLSHLNDTVMTELHGFRQAYDQLWQSTVIELESQREQYQREMVALSSRLTLVADELVWQKRMGIVQSTLLLLCLGMVLFARQGNSYVDMTLAQQLMSKSQAALRSGWESEPNSPSPASRSPVSMFRRRIWRSSTEPAHSIQTDESESRPQTRDGGFEVDVQPPTPETESDSDEAEEAFEDAPGTQSGPATPNGTAAGLKRTPGMPLVGSSPLRYQRHRSN